MRLHYLWLVLLVGACILFSCKDDSNSENITVTQVTFTHRDSRGPDNYETVTITSNSIETVSTASGNITRQCSKQIEEADFNSIQKIINDYNLFQSDDITTDIFDTPDGLHLDVMGGTDTTITINRSDDSSHTFVIGGGVSSGYWPEGVRALVELKSDLLVDTTCVSSSIKIYGSRGSVQCYGDGTAPDIMQYELINAGIEVISYSCGTNGRIYPAVCGARTSEINIFEIPESMIDEAQSLGFSKLSADPDAHEIPCH